MNILELLQQLAREKDVPFERLVENFQKALVAGYKKQQGGRFEQEVTVELDESSPAGFRIWAEKKAVEQVLNPQIEVALAEARAEDPETELGDSIDWDVTPDDLSELGRIAAQTVKKVMTQGIREIEREVVYNEYIDRVGEILPGVVQRTEAGKVLISLGKTEAVLPRSEQMRGDEHRFGDRLEVYILRVDETSRSPQVIVSRSHPNLLRRLFEREVPEIHEGIVEIASLAREAGVRSKVAVATRDANVDPVGACVGHRGSRVTAVTNELGPEKVDVIRYYEDPRQFIQEALQPAKIAKVILSDDGSSATVVVPDDQQSLAIGRAGQNVRLAARLTGLKLDIRSETQMALGEGPPPAPSE
ncbi:MAG: transcription termination/antitermination protein NusA [Fimbriimonadaceae bacterium]|nr:transcription termination/antitermination protein NusA [Fimbriimonadaceae bacterium]